MNIDGVNIDDLISLQHLNDDIILKIVEQRYTKNLIYTYIGDVLLAVNPCHELQIYNKEHHAKYKDMVSRQSLSPHIFWTAEHAHRELLETKTPQCIVVTGETGTGKTESTKYSLKHLLYTTECNIPNLQEKIEQVNPLIELIGNAATVFNRNSSRFGKLIELNYSTSGHVLGGTLQTFILEKSRVVMHGMGERNFHIFHAFFAGMEDQYLRQFYFLENPTKYRIMQECDALPHQTSGAFHDYTEREEYKEKFNTTLKILKNKIGFSEEELKHLWAILAAILHIGNIEFILDEESQKAEISEEMHVQLAVEMLGLDTEDSLSKRFMSSLVTTESKAAGEIMTRHKTQRQAEDERDALAKELYNCVFSGIIEKINETIRPKDHINSGPFDELGKKTEVFFKYFGIQVAKTNDDLSFDRLTIGLLDISGFENFYGNKNSFEQLLINITNEKIHQYFQKQIFEEEIKELTKEGIPAQDIPFTGNKHILELIFERPGVLSILEEEVAVPRSNDTTLVKKLNQYCSSSSYYKTDLKKKLAFGIVHYAGEVVYNADGFLEKNKGTLSTSLKSAVLCSNNIFVKRYFHKSGTVRSKSFRRNGNSLPEKRVSGKMYSSLTTEYKKSLHDLNDTLSKARPLFVRCVKPNINLQKGQFNKVEVSRQLRSSGILELTTMKREGYPIRLIHDHFLAKYKDVLEVEHFSDTEKQIVSILQKIPENLYKSGRVRIFLKYEAVKKLEAILEQKREEVRRKREEKEKEKHRRRNSKSSRSSSVRSTSSNRSSKDIKKKFDDKEILSDTETSLSSPPAYEDLTEYSETNEKETDVISGPLWDVFRIGADAENTGCEDAEVMCLRFSRMLIYIVLFVLILSGGVSSLLLLLSFSKELYANDSSNTTRKKSELFLAFSAPLALQWILSVLKICFGSKGKLQYHILVILILLEGSQVLGTTGLLFKVLPYVDITTGACLICGISTVPAVFNVIRQITLSMQGHRKLLGRFLSISSAITAVLLQISIYPLSWFNDIIKKYDSRQDFEFRMTVWISLFLVSLGWLEPFIVSNIGCIPCLKWRKQIKKSREKIDSLLIPTKVFIFYISSSFLTTSYGLSLSGSNSQHTGSNLSDCVFVPSTFSSQLISNMTSNISQNIASTALTYTVQTNTTSTFINHSTKTVFCDTIDSHVISSLRSTWEEYQMMILLCIIPVCMTYIAAVACKLHMQRFSFSLALQLVPISTYLLSTFACKYIPFVDASFACDKNEVLNLKTFGIALGLWISVILISWHVWFPNCERMAKNDTLFVFPLLDGFFTTFSLLFRRRVDGFEEHLRKHGIDADKKIKRKKKKKERSLIYVCGTMWHETRQEMVQLLKSLFRLDFYHSQCQIAEETFQVDIDYFDPNIHILFDDAFVTDENSQQRVVNDWVKQLVACIDEAAESVAKGRIKWDREPVKTSTPYGGRLTWTMPGGTEMVFHLKDKEKIRHRKRWSQIMYLYYLLGFKFMSDKREENVIDRKKKHKRRKIASLLNNFDLKTFHKADSTFVLTLDGDVDFKPESVKLLLDKMVKNDKVGAVCGRIHPIGSGPMVWYQQFEYAVGHWLQKAAEHVFGCVLCCPGCFSLFRAAALMDDNVMKRYTTSPTEATHYIQYEQGEDRWLCTLLLQQGWKIDYCAGADALTYSPETFKDFFVQRRRWAPSTMANIIDLVSSWCLTVTVNDNISSLFMFYQFVLLASSIFGPGTVTLMIAGSYSSVFGWTSTQGLIAAIFPVLLYIIICLTLANDIQIMVAALMATFYAVVMVIVSVGTFLNMMDQPIYSPNVSFVLVVAGLLIITALLHPKEIVNLLNGLLYYLTVPSTFVFLTVYYLCNLHNVSWGTRENKKLQNKPKKKQKAGSKITKILNDLGITSIVNDIVTFIKSTLRREENKQNHKADDTFVPHPKPLNTFMSDRRAVFPEQITNQELSINSVSIHIPPTPEPEINREKNEWGKDECLGNKTIGNVEPNEELFWQDIIGKYLHPINEDSKHKEKITADLLTLRNNVVFGFFLLNLLFVIFVYQLQSKKDALKDAFLLGEYEPVSLAFLAVFAIIFCIQFNGMIIHRWGTFQHLIASTSIGCRQKSKETYAQLAMKEAGKLQNASLDQGIDTYSPEGSVENNDETFDPDYSDLEDEPDYSSEEPDYLDDENENDAVPDLSHSAAMNAYARNFQHRFDHRRRYIQEHNHNINHESRARHGILSRSHNTRDLYNKSVSSWNNYSKHIQNV